MLAVELGAHALGFIFEPSSPRYREDRAPTWIAELPPYISRVAVFGPFRPGVDLTPFDTVQATTLPAGIGALRIVQTVRLGDKEQKPPWAAADAVLLDAFSEEAYGGTGKQIDLEVARKVTASLKRPVILAGGLTPSNVEHSVRVVRPFAVDVSSGVERESGVKDHDALREFFEAVRRADYDRQEKVWER